MCLMTTKQYTIFQFNTSRKKKCGKLPIGNIPSQKRGITHSKFDKIRQNVNFICVSLLQSHIQNFSSISQIVSKKTTENYLYA